MDQKIINGVKVCVTGGSGYIGSCLVKKLLERGYTVHATLRNLDDESKVSLLKSFPGAESRLALFKANINEPAEFASAIQGCECVFHVAHQTLEYQNMIESTLGVAKSIATSCLRSDTVKRLIYTGSVFACSPLMDDDTGFKEFVDETCWTPLHLPIPFTNDHLEAYKTSKALAEKELLAFGKESDGALEVVTLGCGLVGGGSPLPFLPGSVSVIISQLTNIELAYHSLMYIEELVGKVPLLHVEDACEAHIFCMENPSVHGRVLCASSYVPASELAAYFQRNYPQFQLKEEYLEGPKRKIEWSSSKLEDNGFEYKYEANKILDDSINYAKSLGDL